ncbi:hypothetical protein PVAP13_3NG292246 [Panicum virgatum]|uniref:WAT1-related protein n=1 Tax=Panicum virgatum TaxID=38727 RepID=A0A8T0UD93_PANVG|nr:hypothetical protein PVAP13_3NG292246 [Panicum virgatum]
MPAGGRGAAGGKGGARRPPAPKAAVPPACGRLRGRGAEVFPGRRRRAGGAEAVSMRATRRAPALKGASPACWGFPRPSDSPMFVAMWNPLSLLLTVLCFSLLGETVCLGSIWGGILLAGGLYCVLWDKNKEETRAAMALGQQEHRRELDDVEAGGREHHVLVNFLWFL